jgi:translocation and assembly module TamB
MGTFVFLGRLFKLESGTLSFYGQEEINPSLDLTVTSNIEDYRVIIKLTGTLEKPELRLTSDPDLPEGDIMAMIVFGKPLDSLNEGQGNMLQQRTAEIAIAMGAAKLTQSLSGQGGVDVVSVRSARGTGDTGSALVVGKYITPELLVSYEQALKEKSTSYIVLEYMLTRYIKLETLYSNQSKTGLGLSVEKNY